MTRPAPTVNVPVEADAGLLSVISAMVRRIAVPVSVEDEEVYFDNGHARQIYQAIIQSAPAAPQAAGVGEEIWETAAKAKGWRFSPAHDEFVHDEFPDRPPSWEDCCDLSDLNTLEAAQAFLATLRAPSREPEGGAVWRQALERIGNREVRRELGAGDYGVDRSRCPSCGHAWDDGKPEHHADECALMIARAALATREEAPAEAGAKLAKAMWGIDLVHAQPQAREDAQPVAWTEDMERERREADYERGFRHGKKSALEDARPTRWGLVDASGRMLALTYESAEEAASMGRRCPTVVLTPTALYTHPAPDALRETFEDIKSAADSFRDCEGDEVAEQVILRCDKALAALQAEQGAK